jgi:2-polyprenyl-6-methoxyphenol hydroxylase-like FAD-dependent oxidoreductase
VLWRRCLVTLAPLIPPSLWASIGQPVRTACFADEGALITTLNLQDGPSQPQIDAAQADLPAATVAATSDSNDATDAVLQTHTNSQEQQQQKQHSGRAHALPAGMLVTQADVEATLVALLRDKFGITVQHNTSLTSFTVAEDSSSVLCTLSRTSNRNSRPDSMDSCDASQQIRASYLIGCDGARSTVRKLLGCKFAGSTLDQRWLLGDFEYVLDESINAAHKPQHPFEGSLHRGVMFLNPTDVGLMGLLPLGRREGQLRIVWNAGG